MGITSEELQVLFRIVSWATCGTGRSRPPRTNAKPTQNDDKHTDVQHEAEMSEQDDQLNEEVKEEIQKGQLRSEEDNITLNEETKLELTGEEKAEIGRRGKALVDWARVLALRDAGFDARLYYFVPLTVSPENLCIVATKLPQ
ncbi:unnamed protein product [Chilo suppressalis]|uniref:tRNA:m(4)X modification enzyme TRM13 n=1 Tax=Chilo suppressalis TaxID=168631 RepID=A0ABN8L4V2_CHISP|nr:unnamed protein product [Chilo suppressalis]